MAILDALRGLLGGSVDAQSTLENPLFAIGAALSPDVRAQEGGLQRLALMQEDQRRRQQLEDFYAQLAGGPSPSVQTAGMGGAGAPTGPAPPQAPAQGMQSLIAPPAAPAGEVDVFQGLTGGGMAAPQPNFMGAAPMAAPTAPTSPASGSPDTETLARRMIASGIPEIANQGVALLGQVEAQQARLQAAQAGGAGPAAVQEYQFFQGLSPEEQEQYQRLKRRTQRVVMIAGVPHLEDSVTGEFTPLQTPEDVARAAATIGGAEARATVEGRRAGEIAAEDFPQSAAAQRQRRSVIEGQAQRLTLIEDSIDQAIGQVGRTTAGFIGASAAQIPGTDAADLSNTLSTIAANIGFSELQRMRDASPTGGALGQVSEREIALLTSVLGAISQNQSPDQLRDNLRRLKTEVRASWERINRAYQQDLEAGLFTEQDVPRPQGPGEPQPDQPTPQPTRRYDRETGTFVSVN